MSESHRDLAFLAAKAAVACIVTLLLDRWVGNPDSVSSTFVAVLCVSPVVLMGIRQAGSQLAGSFLGGIWGALGLALGLPALTGVPLAVGLAILSTYLARMPSGYPIAAFTALYLILVPRETPLDTLGVRLLAVTSGAVAGFLVNLVVSATRISTWSAMCATAYGPPRGRSAISSDRRSGRARTRRSPGSLS